MRVTVRLFGSPALSIRTQTIQLELPPDATAGLMLQRLEEALATPPLAEKLAGQYVVMVDGTAVEHLSGWETPLVEGSVVSIVPVAMGG